MNGIWSTDLSARLELRQVKGFPAGTTSDDRVMVAQELFAEATCVAPLAPENVQEAARSSTIAAGLTRTAAVLAASASQKVERGAIVLMRKARVVEGEEEGSGQVRS